ncbi:MAG: hypothetical protein HY902_10280 [Deltaproteobacteria bacterium]|nr:hypothetical protein [Deltaproteobacteria bacterium]
MRLVWLAAILLIACGDPPLDSQTQHKADAASADGKGSLDSGVDGVESADAGPDSTVSVDAEPGADAAAADAEPADTATQDVSGQDAEPDSATDTSAASDTADALAGDTADTAQGDATSDTGNDTGPPPPSTITGGHCDAPFAPPAKQDWKHSIASPLVTIQGGPNHRIRDLILPLGGTGKLRGRFTYGTLDSDLGDETVELWVQTCPGWVKWGAQATDSNGIVYFDVPASLPAGDYRVKMVLLGDQTVADGVIAAWPAGVQAVVTDIDGTLTTSDWELFQDVIFGASAAMYPDANTAMQQFGKKDYRLVYVTGRPQMVNRYSRIWLADHDFPLGPLFLTEDVAQTLPTATGVQKFKADLLNDLKSAVKINWIASFGNATTDIGAYYAAGLPKDKVFIIGPNAGADGSTPIISYTAMLPQLFSWPTAVQP